MNQCVSKYTTHTVAHEARTGTESADCEEKFVTLLLQQQNRVKRHDNGPMLTTHETLFSSELI